MFELFKEATSNRAAPLQVRGNKGLENRAIIKCIVMLCSAQHKGYIGEMSTENARTDSFWRELNLSVINVLRMNFKNWRLYGICALMTAQTHGHCILCAPFINKIIVQFKECFDNFMLPTTGHKILLNICLSCVTKN